MNHVQAINRLIERNQRVVNKNGVTDYTKETDSIVNALLEYVKSTELEIARLKTVEQRATIILQFIGIPDYLEMDTDYLKKFIAPNQEIIIGYDDRKIELRDIRDAYRHYKNEIEHEYWIYNTIKDFSRTGWEVLKPFEKLFPDYVFCITRGVPDSEVLNMIKEKIQQYE